MLGFKINSNTINIGKNRFPLSINRYISDRVKKKDYLTNVLICSIIYTSLFLLYFLVNRKGGYLTGSEFQLMGYYLLSLAFGSLISRKYEFNNDVSSEKTLIKLYFSLVISLLSMSFFLHFIPKNYLYRDQLLIVFFSGLVLESYYYMMIGVKRAYKAAFVEHKSISVKYLLLDGLILASFCFIWLVKPLKSASVTEIEFIIFAAVFLSWIISASTTHKFVPVVTSVNRWNAVELQIKFYVRIILLVITSLIFLNIEYNSAVYFIKVLVSYSIVSSIVSMALFANKIKNKRDEATVVFLKAYEMKDAENRVTVKGLDRCDKYAFKDHNGYVAVNKQQFHFEYLKQFGEVFSVLDTMLDLNTFDTRKSLLIKSDEPNDTVSKNGNSYQLFVNLHILNDQVNLNQYILNVKDALVQGGVFVGALLPHHYRYKKYLKQYSFWTAHVLYFFDFMWKRVFPKLPVTRELYSVFSKDKDRAISLAEGLGRLVYCGFKVLDLAVVDDVVYFAALKNGSFNPVKKFFYSPLFKMKRVGYKGKPIFVYKLRTMYPYSEFIQDFVYKHNNLENGGKFKDDFRVPAWGKMFRKLWIDELPMLINWVKGDLKFVGVRPISDHYLSLYSEQHRLRRINFKPGLFPPFYADLPNTLQEIELSEKRYLDAYEKNPFRTDIKYFIKSLNNIFLNHKRSA